MKRSLYGLAIVTFLFFFGLMLGGCNDPKDLITKLAAFTTNDINAMLTNATKGGDQDGITCANTLLKLQPQIQAAAPAVKGVLSGVEAAMILTGSSSTPGSVNNIVGQVNTGCAAWFLKLQASQVDLALKGLSLIK
jgi:hypothetical protein